MQVPDAWWDQYRDVGIDTSHRYGASENIDKTRAALAMCANIDWNIGRLISHLESLHLLDNTLIIYMSDNGPNGWRWNNGLKGIKGHTDEGGVRSPMIMYWKNKLVSTVIDEIVGAIDLFPTLAAFANVSIPEQLHLDGANILPLLTGDDDHWKDRMIFSHWQGRISVRNKRYMMDHEDQLFDMLSDPEQNYVIESSDSTYVKFKSAKERWRRDILGQLIYNRKEIFPIGFENSRFTHLPARDGSAHGNMIRSNRWPNSSYFTNWTSVNDSITWNCDILNEGNYKATIYYTCDSSAIHSDLTLRQGGHSISRTITLPHDPPFTAVNFDRVPRMESYEKDFRPLELGVIQLHKGQSEIVLKSSEIKGPRLIDFRLLVLERL